MIRRILSATVTALLISVPALADMAPPSPRPTAAAQANGITFGVHDVSRSLTPFGWGVIVVALLGMVVLAVGVLRSRAAKK